MCDDCGCGGCPGDDCEKDGCGNDCGGCGQDIEEVEEDEDISIKSDYDM